MALEEAVFPADAAGVLAAEETAVLFRQEEDSTAADAEEAADFKEIIK